MEFNSFFCSFPLESADPSASGTDPAENIKNQKNDPIHPQGQQQKPEQLPTTPFLWSWQRPISYGEIQQVLQYGTTTTVVKPVLSSSSLSSSLSLFSKKKHSCYNDDPATPSLHDAFCQYEWKDIVVITQYQQKHHVITGWRRKKKRAPPVLSSSSYPSRMCALPLPPPKNESCDDNNHTITTVDNDDDDDDDDLFYDALDHLENSIGGSDPKNDDKTSSCNGHTLENPVVVTPPPSRSPPPPSSQKSQTEITTTMGDDDDEYYYFSYVYDPFFGGLVHIQDPFDYETVSGWYQAYQCGMISSPYPPNHTPLGRHEIQSMYYSTRTNQR